MPRRRANRSPPIERRSDAEDDDFFLDDSQSGSGRSSNEPQHRNAANARERARMRVLSKAFCRLKTTLPWVPADTKLSKLDTLRLAASYIAHLRALLHEPRSAHTPPHPLTLAWPFAFQHGGSLSCGMTQRYNHVPNDTMSKHQEVANDYSENDYEDRSLDRCDDMNGRCEELHSNDCSQSQYCEYGYKDNYYEMRNNYVPDNNMINNV